MVVKKTTKPTNKVKSKVKKTINLNNIFRDYKKAIAVSDINNLIEINNQVVHKMNYTKILNWSEKILELAKNWKGKLNTKGKQVAALQLRFLLEKLKWYEPIIKSNPNVLIELETEVELRRASWSQDASNFDENVKKWESGKLNCIKHKVDKINVNTCRKCITNFDDLIEARLKEMRHIIEYIEVNKINMEWKRDVLKEMIGAYNGLVDVHKDNRDFISSNPET